MQHHPDKFNPDGFAQNPVTPAIRPAPPNVVIFDGVCNLCTRAVQFILQRERSATLRFTSIQSAAGARILIDSGLDPEDIDTVVLVENGEPFVRSDAALRITSHLRYPWRLLTALRVVPRPLRDLVYGLVARNRYRWFGRKTACMIPSPSLAARFLED